jgi:lysophospholipase L1-like esterase
MNGMAQSYAAAARWQLAVRHSFVLDTAGCRRLITTSCHIGTGRTPTDALTALVARAGQFQRVLVVGAGYNDTTNGPTGVGAAIDVLIAEAHRQGVEHVVWLTYREAGRSATRYRAHNAVVRLKDIAYPELTVADWATLSATMPANWFSADGIHLGAQAAEGMADLIADAIDLLPSPASENSCPGVAARAAAAGVLAVGPVQRPRVWCRRYPV